VRVAILAAAIAVACTGCETVLRDLMGPSTCELNGTYEGEWKVTPEGERTRKVKGRVELDVDILSSDVSGYLWIGEESARMRGHMDIFAELEVTATSPPFNPRTILKSTVSCGDDYFGGRSCYMLLKGTTGATGTRYEFSGRNR
jgi:hypothetical protein